MALAVPGILFELAYYVIDHGLLLPSLRPPMKRLVNEHAIWWIVVVLPSFLVFSLCFIFKVIQWASRSAGSDYKIIHRFAYGISVLLLVFVGFFIGNTSPILWVIIQTCSIQFTVWSAPFVFLTAALGTERFCPKRHQKWLRPLVWSAVVGSLVLLVHLLVIDWKIDLTI